MAVRRRSSERPLRAEPCLPSAVQPEACNMASSLPAPGSRRYRLWEAAPAPGVLAEAAEMVADRSAQSASTGTSARTGAVGAQVTPVQLGARSGCRGKSGLTVLQNSHFISACRETEAGSSLQQGARVWIPDSVEVWRVAEITRDYKEGDSVLCLRLEDGLALAYPIGSQLPPLCNPDCLSDANDLVALSYLHEPAVLHSLRRRFLEANAIYTYCGIILVAINPYKPLPIYEEEVIYAYSGRERGDMDPHIFALAEEAYKQMVRFGKNQSLIISGESGAGKTASAKYAMRYFTTIGGCLGNSSMEEKVLASSTIMEAFGNAKTTRNDNSSRFGKYIEIGFNQAHVTGATIKTYLLEKSRVTFQAKAERNYHIFYQLCASATLPELQGLRLCGSESFHYTCQGQCAAAQSTNDADDLDSTRHAFSLLGIPEADQLELFSILASILHLGNIVVRGRDRRGDGCFVEPADEALGLFCTLLGIESLQVTRWLCHRKLVVAGETYLKPLSRQQALDSRDALAKLMYGQVFRWIVSRVNRALRSLEGHHTSIGILDIYGFEMFELNSFEQFCINYANEKLQQLFNLHVFKLEQEEYVAEEIPWVFDFCDNQPCIKLIEGRLGILDLLNEECKMPQGSDGSWAQKLYQTHLSSSHFQKPKRPTDAFVVCHFAGKVEYQCDGFVEKNRDAVPEELVGLLRASKTPWICVLRGLEGPAASRSVTSLFHLAWPWQKSVLLAEPFLEEGDGAVSLQSRRSSGLRMPGRLSRRSLPSSQKSKKSIATQFKASLTRLMEMLSSTTPHYIRCIKPNDSKQPFVFDSRRAVEQLRACGVLDTIRISASGYPSRWTYQEFLVRYRVLVSKEELVSTDEKQICSLALERLLQDPSKYQCGNSKVFFRAGQVAYLEELRYQRLRAAYTLLQRHLRGWLARRRLGQARAAVICLQRHARGWLARRVTRMLHRTRAAVVLQKTLRMVLARRSYLRTRQAAITIQAFARGMFARHFYRQMVWHQKAMVIQAAVRGWLVRTHYARLRGAVIYLQCCYRRVRARQELRRLRAEARSVEHYKQLHKGMEIKVIQLQCRLDEQAQEKQWLVEQLSGLNAAHAEEVQRLRAEMQQLREDLARDALVQQLQERLAEQEKHSMRSCLGQEVEELRQRLAEVEAMKLQLGEERDALMQRILEQSQDWEEQHQRAARESLGLQQELEEERARYQSLVQDYARLEQGYENLRDEVAFHRVRGWWGRGEAQSNPSLSSSWLPHKMVLSSRLRQVVTLVGTGGWKWQVDFPFHVYGESCALGLLAGSWSHWGGVSAEVVALVSSMGCCAKPCLCTQGLEEGWQPLSEGPQPSGEVLPKGGVGQDPSEKAYLPLLGKVNEELARSQEKLQRSKAPVEPEERKPLDFLKRRRNIAEMLGLGRSPEKVAADDDLKHAYDAVQVASSVPGQGEHSQLGGFIGEIPPQFPWVHMCRLLASQLQEEKQQHEEEVEGLHLDICSLKQLSQQQAALIQDLQQHQGQEGLQQQHVLRLKEENLELARKLQKQERTTVKLQKQLIACAKQIQELTAKREALRPARELAASAVVLPRFPTVPYLAGLSQAMLAWRMEDKGRIIKTIITASCLAQDQLSIAAWIPTVLLSPAEYKPQSSPGALPDLPAYILFLCFRHADHCCDELRACSLLDAAIDAIKRVMKKRSDDFDVVALWLANTCRLLNCLRQYGQDESYWQGNTPRQNEHRLQHVDPRSSCHSLGALAVQLYQQLIRTAEKRLKPMIVAAMLESEPIQGLSSSCPPSHCQSSAAHTLPELLQQLGSFQAALDHHGLVPSVGHQVLRQLLFLISGTTLNYLLLRKDTCSWSRGIQLRYNISQLEQWLRAEGLQQSEACEVLEPLVQAAQLLQLKKVTEEDAGALCSLCTVLSPQQVVKILRAYTPAVGLEECVSPSFIMSVEKQLQDQYGGGPSQLLVDTSHLFPVHLPFTASPLHLDELCIPDTLDLAFLACP
ncbi:unconventional myosin-Vb-like [Rhynochetos jubatus]